MRCSLRTTIMLAAGFSSYVGANTPQSQTPKSPQKQSAPAKTRADFPNGTDPSFPALVNGEGPKLVKYYDSVSRWLDANAKFPAEINRTVTNFSQIAFGSIASLYDIDMDKISGLSPTPLDRMRNSSPQDRTIDRLNQLDAYIKVTSRIIQLSGKGLAMANHLVDDKGAPYQAGTPFDITKFAASAVAPKTPQQAALAQFYTVLQSRQDSLNKNFTTPNDRMREEIRILTLTRSLDSSLQTAYDAELMTRAIELKGVILDPILQAMSKLPMPKSLPPEPKKLNQLQEIPGLDQKPQRASASNFVIEEHFSPESVRRSLGSVSVGQGIAAR